MTFLHVKSQRIAFFFFVLKKKKVMLVAFFKPKKAPIEPFSNQRRCRFISILLVYLDLVPQPKPRYFLSSTFYFLFSYISHCPIPSNIVSQSPTKWFCTSWFFKCFWSRPVIDDTSPVVEATDFRWLIGLLQYLSITRLDITFAVNKLAQSMHVLSEISSCWW